MNRPPIAKNPAAGQRSEGTDCHRSPRWRKFRLFIFARNPICNVLENGQECHRAAFILHHLISPLDRPDLQFVTSNVVPCCLKHHPNTRGTPWWVEGVHYKKTKGFGDPL